jgi:gamma-glutamyltranspeptidase/glutathione hydrolase
MLHYGTAMHYATHPGLRLGILLTMVTSLVGTATSQTIARNGMVATHHPLATQAGLRILQQGGNAADAAIASAAVLAVVNPFMCGLGGVGGYAMVYDAKTGKTEALDFIGDAPKAATLDKFRGDRLWDFAKTSTDGYLAPVVPGILAGWAALHDRYGSMTWAQILAPAIDYAENGFPLTPAVAGQIASTDFGKVTTYPYGRSIFSNPDGSLLRAGDIWVQKDLAATLKQIAAKGPVEFYKGEIAKKIAGHMHDNGGLITAADLAAYEAHWSQPIETTYRGYRVLTVRPGSSGMTVLQDLNILEGFDLEAMGRNSADYIHTVAEAEKLGFLDDDQYNTGRMGAPVPLDKLLSKEYAATQRARINSKQAQYYPPYRPGSISQLGEHTNHHTVIDKNHNIVTITQTLMYPSGVVVPETGIFLNNGMCYFSLDANDPNHVEGGARPRFVMSPVIVFRFDKPYFATGAAGGWTISQTILQTILNLIDFRLTPDQAAAPPRFILRYLANSIPYVPGTDLTLDPGISDEVRKQLEARGHRIIKPRENPTAGFTPVLNTIVIDPKTGALWSGGGAAGW